MIGSTSIPIKGHFDSVSYQMISNTTYGNSVEVSLFDDTDYIEDLLINSGRVFSIMFPGYLPIKFDLLEVNPTYGTISSITFTGVSSGCSRMQLNTRSYEGVSISEIATDVISQNPDWEVGEVEETEVFEHPEGGVYPFVQAGETDIEFLNRLCTFAKSKKTGACSYSLTFNDGDSKSVVNFKPENIEDEVSNFTFSLADVSNARSGRVISYSPDLSLINSVISLKGIEESKEAEEVSQSLEPSEADKEGDECLIGDDTEYTKYKTDSLYNRMANLQFSASIDLWGIDWNITVQKVVSVYAYRSNGKLHYSSGRYYVKSVTNNIRGGVLTQTVDMHRSSSFGKIDKEVSTDEGI